MNLMRHLEIDRQISRFGDEEFSRQLATLRTVAFMIGEAAVTQQEMDMARDLVGLLRHLNDFDKEIQ